MTDSRAPDQQIAMCLEQLVLETNNLSYRNNKLSPIKKGSSISAHSNTPHQGPGLHWCLRINR